MEPPDFVVPESFYAFDVYAVLLSNRSMFAYIVLRDDLRVLTS